MNASFQLANFLEDLDIDFDSIPDEKGNISLEFMYEDKFYEVEFIDDATLVVNGEQMSYRDFIVNNF
jgi:hypothetical protein